MDKSDIDEISRDFCLQAGLLRGDYNLPEETKAMLWDMNFWLRNRLEALQHSGKDAEDE